MGFFEALENVNRLATDVFGETVTYTPAGGGESFTAKARFVMPVDQKQYAPLGYADATQAKILHSYLSDAGLTEPTAHDGNSPGDTITHTGPNGELWSWEVTKTSYRNGEWVLDIEKNLRFRP